MAQTQRRRPMTREEALARQQRMQRLREKEEESRELARGPIDLPFCLLVILLTGIGLVMLLSASFPSAYYINGDPTHYFVRQGIFAIAGIAAMFLISHFNYQRLRPLAKPLLYLAIILLVLVVIPGNPFAVTRNNATRWLGVGELFTFQPSEIAKVAVVVYFSNSISKKKDKMYTTRYGIVPYLIIMGVIALFMLMEPHLSGTVLILGTGAVLMLVGGINLGWVIAAVGGAAGVAALMFSGIITYGPVPDCHVAQSVAGCPGRRLPAGAKSDFHRVRRPFGRGTGKEPAKVFVSAGRAQRLYFCHCLRRAGIDWGYHYHAALCRADSAGILDCPACPGPLRQLAGGGCDHTDCPADLPEYRRGDGPPAHHPEFPSRFSAMAARPFPCGWRKWESSYRYRDK